MATRNSSWRELFGLTAYGFQYQSYAPEQANVALSRAIDLFALVADRDKYAQTVQPLMFGNLESKLAKKGEGCWGLSRLVGVWVSLDAFVHLRNST